MTELIRLALKNGAAGVVAVPVADDEGYEAAFAALAAMDDIGVVICDSVDREVQQSLRDSAAPPPLPPAGRGSRWPPAGRARR